MSRRFGDFGYGDFDTEKGPSIVSELQTRMRAGAGQLGIRVRRWQLESPLYIQSTHVGKSWPRADFLRIIYPQRAGKGGHSRTD